eukprot:CAMPEP_0119057182 /NCGR_PEP_ID=MMETSP1178-20130426/1697_1 /TAXON_ID=33656 /ORGANISM="unid sp, Strain CCMP2000" /LENGTH=158 /DNA_ID=CAMNT_0007037987 /DNA_START=22 /DNA_END=498 /DNA_ORIENTATION=-
MPPASGESITFHLHALHTHKAAEVKGKWLLRPLKQALISGFLDQVNEELGEKTIMHSGGMVKKKIQLADIARVMIDGLQADIRRPTSEFARMDGAAVQIILEIANVENAIPVLEGHPPPQKSGGTQNTIPAARRTQRDAGGPSALLSILDEAISETRR